MSENVSNTAANYVRLCPLDDRPENAARGYTLDIRGREVEVVVVDRDQSLYAYINSCPHTGVTLNWLPDRFLDNSERYLQCSTHFALFEVETGRCIQGPCHGQSLQQRSVREHQGWLEIDLSRECAD